MIFWASLALGAPPVAVVELFTSQGCSSCPPADVALAELVDASTKDGRNVFAVSYHVDYWDRLGWKDPYSDARWTGRQRSYAKTWQSKRVYTPQAIVNGMHPLVGSKRDLLAASVDRALSVQATATLEGRATRQPDGVQVEVAVIGAPLGADVYVVVAERTRDNQIPAGENAGSTSNHRNVARAMMKTDAPGGQGLVRVPADFDWSQATVFAWVADPLTLQIVGATQLPLASVP